MTLFYGYRKLARIEDWKGLAGDKNWKPTRSAYELAHAWHAADGIPPGIRDAFERSGNPSFAGLRLTHCLVEKPTFLDSFVAPSMTDIMAHGINAAGDPVVLAIEGKADEPFGDLVDTWLPASAPKPTRVRRLAYLAARLGLDPTACGRLRYQLLHRTVSAVSEAELHGASAAAVVVHAFGPEAPENWVDFLRFMRVLDCQLAAKDMLSPPALLGLDRRLPVSFLWRQDPVAPGPAH